MAYQSKAFAEKLAGHLGNAEGAAAARLFSR